MSLNVWLLGDSGHRSLGPVGFIGNPEAGYQHCWLLLVKSSAFSLLRVGISSYGVRTPSYADVVRGTDVINMSQSAVTSARVECQRSE